MTKDLTPNYSIKQIETDLESNTPSKRGLDSKVAKKRLPNTQCRLRSKSRSISSNLSQNQSPEPDESFDLDLSMESNTDNNNLSDVASTCSNLSFPSFSTGSYVMASWRNNFEYLAEVMGHRKRQGELIEYKLKYIWDKVIEWSPSNKLREAAEFEIDYVMQLCRQHGRLSPIHGKDNNKANNNNNNKRPDIIEDNNNTVPLDIAKAKKPRRSESISDDVSIGDNDMVYDKTVAQFHEACRMRRLMKRSLPDEEDSSLFNKSLPVTLIGNEVKIEEPEIKPSTPTPTSPTENGIYQKNMNKSFDSTKPIPRTPKSSIKSYQCPYCPRSLRQEKLLKAHIHNYHDKSNEGSGGEYNEGKTPLSNLNSPFYSANSKPTDSPEASFSNKSLISEMKGYVNCMTCRITSHTTKIDPGQYIQCSLCFTWSHRKCIGMNTCYSNYEKYNSMKNWRWLCHGCNESLKSNSTSTLFTHDWMNYLINSQDRIISSENINNQNQCNLSHNNGIPLTPPSTPPIHYESGSLVLPNSLDVLRNGKSVLSTYRKKVLADSAILLNLGHVISQLLPSTSKNLSEIYNSIKVKSPTKYPPNPSTNLTSSSSGLINNTATTTANNHHTVVNNDHFLCFDDNQQTSQSTALDALNDDSNIGWMDFKVLENMAEDVLSTPNHHTTSSCHNQSFELANNQRSMPLSQTDNSGGMFSLELVPSEVLKDLLHSDSFIPEDINELLKPSQPNQLLDPSDYSMPNVNLTPTKSLARPCHQEDHQTISAIQSPIKERLNTSDRLLNEVANLGKHDSMAFYSSVFEPTPTTSHGDGIIHEGHTFVDPLVDIEDATNCLESIGTNQKSTPTRRKGVTHDSSPEYNLGQVVKDIRSVEKHQLNPLERLLDKFEEYLKKVNLQVDNLEMAYKEDLIQQGINVNNDNMYVKTSCNNDHLSYSHPRGDGDYSKVTEFHSSDDEEFDSSQTTKPTNDQPNDPHHASSDIKPSPSDAGSTISSNYSNLHHFDYYFPLQNSSPDLSRQSPCPKRKLKLFSRLYSLQMAKRDTAHNQRVLVNSPFENASPANLASASSNHRASSVLKNQNRNPGNIKKMDPMLIGNAAGNSVNHPRGRCYSTISPLVAANSNNRQNSHIYSSSTFSSSGNSFAKRKYPTSNLQFSNYRKNLA